VGPTSKGKEGGEKGGHEKGGRGKKGWQGRMGQKGEGEETECETMPPTEISGYATGPQQGPKAETLVRESVGRSHRKAQNTFGF